MRSRVDYPGHRVLKEYFDDFADHFGLAGLFRFDTRVTRLEPRDGGWELTSSGPDGTETRWYAGVVLANGTLAEPNVPTFRGEFSGELLHTSAYKSPEQLRGKRVLLIGAGNSGCDIAVDAVHHAVSVDMSVRRGYYFVPRYLFGKPATPSTRAARCRRASSRPSTAASCGRSRATPCGSASRSRTTASTSLIRS